jgi:hypothetical protein
VGDSRVSRRTLLGAAVTTAAAAGLGGGLSGCVPGPSAPPAQTQPQIDPLTPVLRLHQELVKRYQRVLEAFPELTGALTDLQAQTTAHTEALLAAAPVAAAQIAATGSGTTSATVSSSIPTPAPPADAATALSNLKQAVDASAGALRTAALRANGELAALLGSCAASTTCHERLLTT